MKAKYYSEALDPLLVNMSNPIGGYTVRNKKRDKEMDKKYLFKYMECTMISESESLQYLKKSFLL